jgi:hypothetical protein
MTDAVKNGTAADDMKKFRGKFPITGFKLDFARSFVPQSLTKVAEFY